MAIQALPLLLAGGAGVYVYTRAKKKKERARKCPPENNITLGESETVTIRAMEKHGNAATPFPEAAYYINEILPRGCDRNSKDSRVKMQLGTKEKPIDFDISVPDLYMIVLSGAINRRLEVGKLNRKQAEKFWTDGLNWYKKSTGKNFDTKSLGLEKFAEAIVVAMQEAFKKVLEQMGKEGKKKKEQKELDECPAEFEYVITPDERRSISAIVNAELARENKNPFAIGDRVFDEVVLSGCSKDDYKSVVRILIVFPDGEKLDAGLLNVASFYALMVWQVASQLVGKNVIAEPQLQMIASQLRGDYKKLTGEDLPEKIFD